MKFQIGELIAAEYWENEHDDSKKLYVGIIVDTDKAGWYTVNWNDGRFDVYHVSQIEIYKEVFEEARMVER